MTFSAVGSGFGLTASTFTFSPTTVGDFALVEVTALDTTVTPSSLSSSNATWSALTAVFTGTTNAWCARIFLGKVTSASSATVTITWTGGTPATPQGGGQEFKSTVGNSSVTLDVQGHLDVTAGTSAWPSLTPGHGAGELYFGYCLNGGVAAAGTTSGYVFNANVDGDDNGMAYNVSCPATATGPVWGDTTEEFGLMVLVYEAGAAAPPPVSLVAVNRPALIVSNAGRRGAGHSR